MRRATCAAPCAQSRLHNFYPRSPCGERPMTTSNQMVQQNFYPRSPCGERLPSTPPSRLRREISIHALLAESDLFAMFEMRTMYLYFYPRSPCGERHFANIERKIDNVFLSTLSLRRATVFISSCSLQYHDFYPRSPCGERQSKTPRLPQS